MTVSAIYRTKIGKVSVSIVTHSHSNTKTVSASLFGSLTYGNGGANAQYIKAVIKDFAAKQNLQIEMPKHSIYGIYSAKILTEA